MKTTSTHIHPFVPRCFLTKNVLAPLESVKIRDQQKNDQKKNDQIIRRWKITRFVRKLPFIIFLILVGWGALVYLFALYFEAQQ